MTTIVLIDDHPLYRQGLRGLISTYPGYRILGEAGNRAVALDLVQKGKPDLVLLDLSLGEESGLDLLKDLRSLSPELKVLVVSMHDENVFAERALAAGALGYVQKQEATGQIIEAIRAVEAGRTWFSVRMRERLYTSFLGNRRTPATDAVSQLTDRELEVFRWIGRGLGNRKISETLNVSISTVETHKKHLKEKLGCRDAEELKVKAIQWCSHH